MRLTTVTAAAVAAFALLLASASAVQLELAEFDEFDMEDCTGEPRETNFLPIGICIVIERDLTEFGFGIIRGVRDVVETNEETGGLDLVTMHYSDTNCETRTAEFFDSRRQVGRCEGGSRVTRVGNGNGFRAACFDDERSGTVRSPLVTASANSETDCSPIERIVALVVPGLCCSEDEDCPIPQPGVADSFTMICTSNRDVRQMTFTQSDCPSGFELNNVNNRAGDLCSPLLRNGSLVAQVGITCEYAIFCETADGSSGNSTDSSESSSLSGGAIAGIIIAVIVGVVVVVICVQRKRSRDQAQADLAQAKARAPKDGMYASGGGVAIGEQQGAEGGVQMANTTDTPTAPKKEQV